MTESYKLIKENGDELEFNNGEFYLRNLSNLGNPNIDYTTQTTFYQDGASVTNFVVSPRQINFPFLAQVENINKRTQFWDLRREILSFLSPASGPMSFQLTLDDHITYELSNVYPTNGLSMEGNTFSSDRNDGRIDEILKLTAFDPIWRVTPINSTGSLTPTISESLIFPIEFPIEFGGTGAEFDSTIVYSGTWKSYPKITISGPYSTATFTNKQNSATFKLITSVPIGGVRVIDLTDPIGGFTIVDGSGDNKINELDLTSNLTQFYFEPDQTNGIDAVLNGGDLVNTSLTIEHYTKYLGI